VFVAVGDFRQIVPVVKNGTFEEVKNACIQNSRLWRHFEVRSLNVNMRLERLRQQILLKLQDIDGSIQVANDQGDLQQIQTLQSERGTLLSDEEGQRNYARMILQIGNGNVTDSEKLWLHNSDPPNYTTTYFQCKQQLFCDER